MLCKVFSETDADSFIIKIDEAKATPLLNEVAAYLIDEKLWRKLNSLYENANEIEPHRRHRRYIGFIATI
jgi:accessory colonization factor AcfC